LLAIPIQRSEHLSDVKTEKGENFLPDLLRETLSFQNFAQQFLKIPQGIKREFFAGKYGPPLLQLQGMLPRARQRSLCEFAKLYASIPALGILRKEEKNFFC